MAERVDIRRESRTREIIVNILKSHKVLDENQLWYIMQKWNHYEYKISGINRNFPVFCEYIKFQETLLQFIRLKTLKRSIKATIERNLVNDIKRLIEICSETPAYQGEFDLFILKLSFFRMVEDFNAGSATAEALIKFHPSNVKTWMEAAKWFVHNKKPEHGIYILQQGLDRLGNPVNTDVYNFLITLEIETAFGKYSEGVLSKQEIDIRKEELVKKLTVYMNDFKDRNWIDSKFLFAIVAKLYESALRNSVIEQLKGIIKEKCGHLYETWKQLVQYDIKEADTDPKLLDKIMIRYQDGFEALASSPIECRLWWSSYIAYLLDINTKGIHFSHAEINKYLMDAFKNAADCHMLDEDHYLNWLDFVSDDEFESIVDRSLNDFPNSHDLYNVKVNCALLRYGKEQQVFDLFEKATDICGAASIEIWNSILRYMTVNGYTEHVEVIYRKGIDPEQQPEQIVNELKPGFIEWLAICKGSDIAIQEYHILCEQKPYCKRLHDVVLKIPTFKWHKGNVLKTYRLLCKQFSNDGDVYYRFVLYHQEFNFNEPILKRKQMMKEIYEDACANLDANSMFFKEFHSLQKKEMIYIPNTVDNRLSV